MARYVYLLGSSPSWAVHSALDHIDELVGGNDQAVVAGSGGYDRDGAQNRGSVIHLHANDLNPPQSLLLGSMSRPSEARGATAATFGWDGRGEWDELAVPAGGSSGGFGDCGPRSSAGSTAAGPGSRVSGQPSAASVGT